MGFILRQIFMVMNMANGMNLKTHTLLNILLIMSEKVNLDMSKNGMIHLMVKD
jgi:hypothetical protein